MPKGHSARADRLVQLRYLLACEPHAGKRKMAGIALGTATGHAEHIGCLIVDRINHLRHEYGYTDADIIRLLNLPDAAARSRHHRQEHHA